MRITIRFTAENREEAARELNMVNYHVMDCMSKIGKRKRYEDTVPLASGARTVIITQ